MKRLLIILALICFGACKADRCERQPTSIDATADERAELATSRNTFGGEHAGFVEWVSANGEFVLLQRFVLDTNQDGKVEARLGDHGEALADAPTPALVNIPDGTVREFDEVIALGPRMRSVVLRRGPDIKIFDTASGRETDLPATAEGDASNPCLPARQAVFDPGGERLAFITRDGAPAVFDVASAEITEFQPVEGLWRVGAPPLDGSVIVQVVRRDTDDDGDVEPPTAKTTCPARWAARFASSIGNYGWDGDAFEQFLVMPDGSTISFDGNLVPVGPDAVWGPSGGLMLPGGDDVAIPRGCELGSVPLGEETVLLQCGPHLALWNPPDGSLQRLEARARPTEPITVPVRPDSGQAWVAVTLDTSDGRRLGRLNVKDGALDEGPLVTSVGRPHPSGWMLARTDSGGVAFHLGTGESTLIPVGFSANAAGLSINARTRKVVDPYSGAVLDVGQHQGPVTAAGCIVASTGTVPPFDKGPWFLRCPPSP